MHVAWCATAAAESSSSGTTRPDTCKDSTPSLVGQHDTPIDTIEGLATAFDVSQILAAWQLLT